MITCCAPYTIVDLIILRFTKKKMMILLSGKQTGREQSQQNASLITYGLDGKFYGHYSLPRCQNIRCFRIVLAK
jgi:hypothetical protein